MCDQCEPPVLGPRYHDPRPNHVFVVPKATLDRKVSEAVLDDVRNLRQMAEEAAARLVGLNARVLGAVPEGPREANGVSPSGFMGELGGGLADLRRQLEAIHSELARAESAL